jgi:hypothetical protein
MRSASSTRLPDSGTDDDAGDCDSLGRCPGRCGGRALAWRHWAPRSFWLAVFPFRALHLYLTGAHVVPHRGARRRGLRSHPSSLGLAATIRDVGLGCHGPFGATMAGSPPPARARRTTRHGTVPRGPVSCACRRRAAGVRECRS